jgi:hypothetical protein
MKALLLALAALSIHASSFAADVKKVDWVEGMKTVIPTMFCAPSRYFRQCFSVSAIECEETSTSATRVCLDKHKGEIPEILVQPKDGSRLGEIIGQCAGIAYEISLKKKRISNAKCDDPNNWRQ